ncbi:hypothetical protein BLOT_006977, partial [Blomia tropicalis]
MKHLWRPNTANNVIVKTFPLRSFNIAEFVHGTSLAIRHKIFGRFKGYGCTLYIRITYKPWKHDDTLVLLITDG